jgi:hypothetical protein
MYNIKLARFHYLISIKNTKNNTYNSCKIPKEKINPHVRGAFKIYYDFDQNTLKQIIYPPDLWFQYVDEDDTIENYIINIKNEWPTWYKIKIYKKNV